MERAVEQRRCAKCEHQFSITERDMAYYGRIVVPPPTHCPRCRWQRRIAFRNERVIYRRPCGLCEKPFISVYHPESPFKAFCRHCFWSGTWDRFASGCAYDPQKSFFEQYRELALRAPKLGIQQADDLENSEFTNHAAQLKDCYLMFASVCNESCMYGNYVNQCQHAVDCLAVRASELTYQCVDCRDCYNLKFSEKCAHATDSAFLYDCRSVRNCYRCTNLRQAEYCIDNKQVSREEFKQFSAALRLGSRDALEQERAAFEEIKRKAIRPALFGFNNEAVTGDDVNNSKNCANVFDITHADDCKYAVYGNTMISCFDVYASYPHTELAYESVGCGGDTYDAKFCYLPWVSSRLEYCINLFSSKNCFGCNQLISAQNCILNMQYTENEYERLKKRIIADMKERSEYGEFFPIQLSPFAYNETIAQDHFPIDEAEAQRSGWLWRKKDQREYQQQNVAVPKDIRNAEDTICHEVLACRLCGKNFRIISEELRFYRTNDLAIPLDCPDCRHKERLSLRNPRRLWKRACAKCQKAMLTSYSADRGEIVCCEACYIKAIH